MFVLTTVAKQQLLHRCLYLCLTGQAPQFHYWHSSEWSGSKISLPIAYYFGLFKDDNTVNSQKIPLLLPKAEEDPTRVLRWP